MFLLVTGASGAGKSTVRAAIEAELRPIVECVELAHVVPVPAAPTLAWRQRATDAVVRRALELQQSGRHLLLAGDPVAAAEVVAAPSAEVLEGHLADASHRHDDDDSWRRRRRGPGLVPARDRRRRPDPANRLSPSTVACAFRRRGVRSPRGRLRRGP